MEFLLALLVFVPAAIGAEILHASPVVVFTLAALAFSAFEVGSAALAVTVANTVARDAELNWLEVALLLMVYGMLAVAFFYY